MKIGVSVGDLNGIGLECFIKATYNLKIKNSFILYSPINSIKEYISKCHNLSSLCSFDDNFLIINNNKILIQNININSIINFGKIDKNIGKIAIKSIEKAVLDCNSKATDFVLTLPISKEACYKSGFEYAGHTEFITKLTNDHQQLMILSYKSLRVALQTVHIPINKISDQLTIKDIIKKIKIFSESLKIDFGVNDNIAVLALNPHAGENGSIGLEEKNIILPAINEIQKMGINVKGPFAADGFFGNHQHKNYEGILAMYHDQGLIPLKYISKSKGINFTAGLSIVRTSPDHGTAFDIAGMGKANYESTKNAIIEGIKITKNRQSKHTLRHSERNEDHEVVA